MISMFNGHTVVCDVCGKHRSQADHSECAKVHKARGKLKESKRCKADRRGMSASQQRYILENFGDA